MDWERDSVDWPNRAASRFVRSGDLRWHVQWMGHGPPVLLVHGTGASTHSFRELAPLLARQCSVLVPDLPGHAFTGRSPARAMSLDGMANALANLLDELEIRPVIAVGHSAGAAVLAKMSVDRRLAASVIMALNGALLPLGGLMKLMSPMAKLMASTSVVPRIVSGRARDIASVKRLIAATGSSIDERGTELYARLMRDPEHVGGVLSMMANWKIDALPRALPGIAADLLLVAAAKDRTVPPAQAERVAARVPRARVLPLPRLGHLAHEEDPAQVAGMIMSAMREHGLLRHADRRMQEAAGAAAVASCPESAVIPSI